MRERTMRRRRQRRPRTLAMALVLVFPLVQAPTIDGALLREASFDVVFSSSSDCQVTASFAIDDADEIEHRLVTGEGAVPTLRGVEGTVTVEGAPGGDRRPRSLRLRGRAPGPQRYRVNYQVAQAGSYRCPLWVPTSPSEGRSREVAIHVTLPNGAVPAGGTLPAFSWEGNQGSARLGHIPAFVRVPFEMAGAPAGTAAVDVTSLMDLIAILVLAGGTVMFFWRQRRQ